jgi:putative glycosyltransferase (TIGR04372 family)
MSIRLTSEQGMKRVIPLALRRAVRRVVGALWATFITALCLIEVPIFLIRNRRLFENKLVCLFWHWSFGHTVSAIDNISRLYYPHRVSLIYVPHPRSNPLLPECFAHNVDPFVYKSVLRPRGGSADRPKVIVLRLALHLISGIQSIWYPAPATNVRKFDLVDPWTSYLTLSIARAPIHVGREGADILEPSDDWTGWIRLLRDGVGERPQLPSALEARARESIRDYAPDFFDKPFVVLLLRGKGGDERFDSAFREAGPHAGYLPGVQVLIDRGYHVVAQGETDRAAFGHLRGFHNLDGCACPPALLNLFLLTRCVLFVGQQSGPLVLANACGSPSLICDALPHRLGTFQQRDLILFKTLRDRDGSPLSLEKIYGARRELAFGCGFAAGGIGIVPNTPEQIAEAMREAVDLLEGKFTLSGEDAALIEHYRELLDPRMTIAYQHTRPPLSLLRDPVLGVRPRSKNRPE